MGIIKLTLSKIIFYKDCYIGKFIILKDSVLFIVIRTIPNKTQVLSEILIL